MVLCADINLVVINPASDRPLLIKANAYRLDIHLDIREIAKVIYPVLVSLPDLIFMDSNPTIGCPFVRMKCGEHCKLKDTFTRVSRYPQET